MGKQEAPQGYVQPVDSEEFICPNIAIRDFWVSEGAPDCSYMPNLLDLMPCFNQEGWILAPLKLVVITCPDEDAYFMVFSKN